MKSFASIIILLRALLLVLLAFICTGNSFKQELWFYDAQDNGLHFQSQVTDTSDHSLFLPKVTRVCTRGVWNLFSTENFQAWRGWLGAPSNTGIVCDNFTTGASVKSLRHFGASDTDTDALSLYEEWAHSGKEVFVNDTAHAGITNKILGVAATGTSDWMLFEGMDFDGNSLCYEVPSGQYLSHNYVSDFNLTTIGSVFKGCDAQEIENYKMLHKSNFKNSN